MIPYENWQRTVWAVSDVIRKSENPPEGFTVTVLWFAWFSNETSEFTDAPKKSWRSIAVSSKLDEEVHFEVSYDHIGNNYYVDKFVKSERTVFEGEKYGDQKAEA